MISEWLSVTWPSHHVLLKLFTLTVPVWVILVSKLLPRKAFRSFASLRKFLSASAKNTDRSFFPY